MNILSIDPGCEFSGLLYWHEGAVKLKNAKAFNPWILENVLAGMSLNCEWDFFKQNPPDVVAVEMIAHYGTGMPAGKTVFDTCVWIGKFLHAAEIQRIKTRLILRATIKAHLCGSTRAKDANVAQALRDKYGDKGTKKNPNPVTYGMNSHLWSALAIVDYVLGNKEALEL